MKELFKYLIFLKLICSYSISFALPNVQMRDDLKKVKKAVDDALVKFTPPGAAIAIVTSNDILYKKIYGLRQVGTKKYVTEKSLFRVGSVTKFFTAVLCCIMQKKGRLDINQKINTLVSKDFFGSSTTFSNVKVLDILRHTSGTPRYSLEERAYLAQDKKMLLYFLKYIKPVHSVGQVHNYQNVIYSLLAEILEASTGHKYSRVLAKEIFDPLNINNFTLSDKNFKEHLNVAKSHIQCGKTEKKYMLSVAKSSYDNILPAAGLAISLGDAIKFVQALLSKKKIINKDILKKMISNKVFVCDKKRKCNKTICFCKKGFCTYYGLGCRVTRLYDVDVIYHTGYVHGYSSVIAVIPSMNIGFIVFTNGQTNLPYFLLEKMCDIFVLKNKSIIK